MKVKLELSDDEFYQLHDVLDKTRPSSKEVKVPREQLRRLLSDHSILHQALEKYIDERPRRENSGTAGSE